MGVGRGTAGIVGFPSILGLGLAATGGGTFVAGRELESELEGVTVFFQGVADPLLGAIPGKTETGFAVALAVEEVISTLGTGPLLGGGGAAGGAGALC